MRRTEMAAARVPVAAVVTLLLMLTLLASIVLLATGAAIRTLPRVVGCPGRTSITVAANGQTLWLRPQAPTGSSTLVHLCTGPSTSPVTHWSVAEGRIAVQRLDDHRALAVVR